LEKVIIVGKLEVVQNQKQKANDNEYKNTNQQRNGQGNDAGAAKSV
jgi:hypothetical protein